MEEFFKHFGVEWKLLAAQAVNFLILLWLLKRFAYQPILALLEKRRKAIEKGMRDAKEARERLAEAGAMREVAIAEAKEEALTLVSEAEETAKKRRQEIVFETNKKVEGIVAGAKRTIAQEKAKMTDSMMEEAREVVKMGVMKVLGKLPARERDEALITEAMKELRTLRHTKL